MAVSGRRKEQCPFALLVPFLYLHMGRRFSIRSLSPSSLSLQSRGSGTVTQHGGVQKVHTTKSMFPMSRKRKRKGLQEQEKHYKKDLPILYLCPLKRIWMEYSCRESAVPTAYTVTTAQIGIVSIHIILWTSYFCTLHRSTRYLCCLSLLHNLPASTLRIALFLCRKLRPQSSSLYGFSS